MPKNNNQKKKQHKRQKAIPRKAEGVSRGAAIRASRRIADSAHKLATRHTPAEAGKGRRANVIDDSPRLKVIALGGMDGGGSKNMILLEYKNEAVVIDAGNWLGINLPGVNFAIPDIAYLKTIKHKVKAYVMTHGHLDHIGALPYILPEVPAPVYGSRFTIGMVEQIIENSDYHPDNYQLKTVVMNQDNHERIKLGEHFSVELVRVTHSIPGSTAVVIDTPLGKVINTGDFRIDEEPLDHLPTDIERLKQLGKEGVLVAMADSTTAERAGRTPTESTIEPSFKEIIKQAPGRVFIAMFSSNINRIQMVVNAAVEHGRKIALDGRSMMTTLETAVKLGFIKIPKGTFISMNNVASKKDKDLVIICTGSQGEENSALVRMANGEHRHVKLKEQDTVALSSTPIPESGNDAEIGRMVDNLLRMGVHVFRHETHELDNVGPLHVSGHASLEEYGEMVEMLQPKFFLPIYGSIRAKKRYIDEVVNRGLLARKNMLNAENGEVIEFSRDKMQVNEKVPHGTVLVDNTGAVVSNVVVKDRLMMGEEGLVAIMLTIDKKSGQLLSSPDIITRGFIYMRDNEELMSEFRAELRRVVLQRFKRVDLDRFKQELRDHVTYFLFERTQRSPIIIPVVNVVSGRHEPNKKQQQKSEMRGHTQPD